MSGNGARAMVSCSAGYGSGGMGQHFAAVVEKFRSAGRLGQYYSPRPAPGDAGIGVIVSPGSEGSLFRFTPLRFSPGWKAHLGGVLFERRVIRLLPPRVAHLCAFNGQALRLFEACSRRGCGRFELVAATCHVSCVRQQHRRAAEQHPIEPDWLNDAQHNRTLQEYARADLIYVGSEHARQSFLAEGVEAAKLERMFYPVDARFKPSSVAPHDGKFRVIYCGSLCVTKGVAVLIEAFRQLAMPNAELLLFGGCATRRMRVWIDRQRALDPRIRMAAGDPLPGMQSADVCVHPSYQDGLGYSPLEALACGVPVIVSEDTGMKEYVRIGINGFVVPTGQWQPILERLEHLAKHPLRGTFAPVRGGLEG